MDEIIKNYVKELRRIESTGISTEMSYYCPLKVLIDKTSMKYLEKDVISVIEAKSQEFGKPDITVLDNERRPIGYIEAKKIGENLTKKKGTIKDYCDNIDNLIFTNFYDFILYDKKIITKKASVMNCPTIISNTTDNVIKLLIMFLSNSKDTQTKDFIYYES